MFNDTKHGAIPFDEETDDYFCEGNTCTGDADDESSAHSTAASAAATDERLEEFAYIMMLLLLKVSLFFIIRHCEERGFDTVLYEIIQF